MSDSKPVSGQSMWPWLEKLPVWGQPQQPDPAAALAAGGPWAQFLLDSYQRSVLFLDVLRQRGDEQRDMTSRPAATVLTFEYEVLMSGRSLPRPINYALSRIIPPPGYVTDLTKRPVIVVDPRAGQGPGIGGFKTTSEIGDALASGHAVYFIGFSAQPEDGQSFLDVVEGQVKFVERIVELHPQAPRPFAIGNCQAGYQTLMVAMLRPDLFGPCMVAGSPMSYWQGEHGKNPMRYAGGLLGGSWMTALVSDLGGGKFDGTWLILNFDNLNPSNFLWDKQYELYKEIDTEAPRYLGFEKWWGDFITLNGKEIQFLVDEMFIGDKLTRNQLQSSDGTVFDMRNLEAPVIVFTSLGDNISPPPQTLGWILDLYKDVEDMQARGKTVVYCVNPHVGHLAIFVSAKVGAKEDEEMLRLMNVIDCMPPGLFELVIEPSTDEDIKAGRPAWHSHFEQRTFDDLRAYGRNTLEDDRAFEAVKRVSELNNAMYRTFVQPVIKASSLPQMAEALFKYNPLRMSYTAFSSDKPYMNGIEKLAQIVRAQRKPVDDSNPFFQFQEAVSAQINTALDAYRDVRDKMVEQSFFSIYGNPFLQSLLGIKPDEKCRTLPGASPIENRDREVKRAEMRARIDQGGFDEALIRAVMYVLSSERKLDGRALMAVQAVREHLIGMELRAFKALVRTQFFVLVLNRDAAITSLTKLVTDMAERRKLVDLVTGIAGAGGTILPSESVRIQELATVLGVSRTPADKSLAAPAIPASEPVKKAGAVPLKKQPIQK